MEFEKSKEYLESIFNFMEVLYKKAVKLNDNKLVQICKLIFKYLITCCNESNLLVKNLNKNDDFSMKPVYEYIQDNKIELLDLNNLSLEDINVTNARDIEKFVLSHIYYIYENN